MRKHVPHTSTDTLHIHKYIYIYVQNYMHLLYSVRRVMQVQAPST